MAFHYILQKVILNYDFHAFLIGNLGRKGSAAVYILSKTENDKKKAIGIPYNFNRHNSIKNMTSLTIPRITEKLYVAGQPSRFS